MKTLLRTFALVLGFAILINPIACVSLKNLIPTTNIPPRESFVKVISEQNGQKLGSGSGVIIQHIENNTFILTAGHICEPQDGLLYALDIELNKHRTLILKVSKKSDLCLLITMDRVERPISPIAHQMPKPGEKTYNLAAPWGIHDKNMILQFEGYYAGRVNREKLGYDLDMHTIPTRPGSSGSPVYNERWEIIGIASMAFITLENVGLMVTLEDIQEFVKDII